jgi:predicted transcriptional regulator
MKLREIADVLRCEPLTDSMDWGLELEAVVASDGMSEILAFSSSGALMLTGLTNIQSVRTAVVADVRAIVYVRGKRPNEKVIELAAEKAIPVLVTSLGMFDSCGILYQMGLKGAM